MSDIPKRVYELGFLLVPTAPETEVPSHVDALKDAISTAGGTVHTAGTTEFIDLAYTIEKNVASKKMKWSQGYFGWIKFESAPEDIEALKKALDANTNVMRYLLTKTSLDNTVIFKKPKIEAKRAAVEEEEVFEDTAEEEDMREDHELLPDLQSDIAENPEGEKEAE